MSNKRQVILDWLKDPAGPLFAISTGSGYNFTVRTIQRGQRPLDDISDGDFPVLFICGSKEGRKLITSNQFRSDLEVEIIGAVKSPDGVKGAQAELDKLIADVTRALETDRLQGGRVNLTTISEIVTDKGDLDAYAAFLLKVVFLYHTEGTTP